MKTRRGKSEWWAAVMDAPAEDRPHRKIYESGKTEEEALSNLAAKALRMGVTGGEIRTIGPLGPEDHY